MICDYPINLAKYASENYLLGKHGWKQFCRYVNNTKKLNRLLKDSKPKKCRNTLKINFGMKIPRDYKEVMIFYADNWNTNWKDDELHGLKKSTTLTPLIILGLSTYHVSLPAILKSKYISFTTTNNMGGIRNASWTLVILMDLILTLIILALFQFVPFTPLFSYLDWKLLIHVKVTSVTLIWLYATHRRFYSMMYLSLKLLDMQVTCYLSRLNYMASRVLVPGSIIAF